MESICSLNCFSALTLILHGLDYQNFTINLEIRSFIYFFIWLHWVFVAARGLP